MNPHDLIKKTYESVEPSAGFTERVLRAAEQRNANRPTRRLIAALVAAVVILSFVSVGVYAIPELRHWLFGVVDVEDGDQSRIDASSGAMDLAADSGDYHINYGAFLCIGRFLFTEVEITTDKNQPISDLELQEAISRFDHDQLELTYVGGYVTGNYSVFGEGWLRSFVRLDDGSIPGYARCTFFWTLARHDYDGTTLLIRLWEPIEWVLDEHGGGMVAKNETTRRLLKETRIERKTPEDEISLWLQDGMEIRVCAFGVELQGDDIWKLIRQNTKETEEVPECGVILEDGTRIPFLNQPFGISSADTPKELQWSAAPFTAIVDPGKIIDLYCEDVIVPLYEKKP